MSWPQVIGIVLLTGHCKDDVAMEEVLSNGGYQMVPVLSGCGQKEGGREAEERRVRREGWRGRGRGAV